MIAKLTDFLSKKLGAFCIVVGIIVINRVFNLGLNDEDIQRVMESGLGYIGVQGLNDIIKIAKKTVEIKLPEPKPEPVKGGEGA
jgi:hypothetical protein